MAALLYLVYVAMMSSGVMSLVPNIGVKQSIEIRAFVDNYAFEQWKAKVATSTLETKKIEETKFALKDFINSVFTDLNSVFAQLKSNSISLDARLVSLEYITGEVISSSTSTASDGSKLAASSIVLDNFRDWYQRKGHPAVDHAMLFTGLDLTTLGSPSTAGVAYLGGMCSSNSRSVVELSPTGSIVTTMAHEIGHSLGANHDAGECDANSHIMAASDNSGGGSASSFRFSSCSIRSFTANSHTCLSNTAAIERSAPHVGELYSPDQMCSLAIGKGSSACRTQYGNSGRSYSSICISLLCDKTVSLTSVTCESVRSPSGFVCGNGKRCFLGECKSSSTAPTDVSDTCLLGDAPGKVLGTGETCSQTISSFTGNCYRNLYNRTCCASCAAARKPATDCQYGDKEPWCKSLDYPYDCNLNAEVCCSGCKQYETGKPACPYGDQLKDCSQYTKAELCPFNADTCCSLCSS